MGQTTSASALAAERSSTVFLDLKSGADRARLRAPELYFAQHRDHLVVLDEVQFRPELFSHLPPEIDPD